MQSQKIYCDKLLLLFLNYKLKGFFISLQKKSGVHDLPTKKTSLVKHFDDTDTKKLLKRRKLIKSALKKHQFFRLY